MSRLSSLLVLFVLLAGCELSANLGDDTIVAGVDMSELFTPATQEEKTAVTLDWATRDTRASGILVEKEGAVSVAGKSGTVRIVSHIVGDVKHYGAIVTPDGLDPASTPVVVYAHGGDSGVSVDNEVLLLLSFFGDVFEQFVYVVPSYRSEAISFDGVTYTSEGEASPWDYDVDDTMALLEVAFNLEPAADPSRVGVLGFSRGAGVGLLMDARSTKIDQVLDFFGPTDFFGPFVQDVTREILLGNPRELPGLAFLSEEFVLPYQREEISLERVRLELTRRSPVLWVEKMSKVQAHHGTADQIVPLSQTQSLVQAMEAAGKTDDEFEYFIYEGGDHNPLTLEGSIERARDFLLELDPGN